MSNNDRILAVLAHPDDEVWCAGTLAAQATAGFDVTLAIACNGNLGGMSDKTPAERAEVRGREMACACGMLGVNLKWMDIGDDRIMADYHTGYADLEMRMRNLIREVDPHLLILQPPDDYHQHHRAVSELALNAGLNASNAAIVSERAPASRVPTVLYTQPFPPATFVPDLWVEITATYELKIAALMCHESQHPFLAGQFGIGLVDMAHDQAQIHGFAAGVRYAEAFSLCRRMARVTTIQNLGRFFPW